MEQKLYSWWMGQLLTEHMLGLESIRPELQDTQDTQDTFFGEFPMFSLLWMEEILQHQKGETGETL